MKKTKELLMDIQNKEEQMAHNGLNGLKQETLEEAAEKYAHNYFNMHETNNYIALKQGYEAGAKEMAERMYTEEDLRRAYNYGMFAVTSGRSFSDWFKERNKQ
jgi:hypothetical protein